jgi:hypothetical protein
MADVFKDSGVRIPLGRWASDPCHRCGRQPEAGEVAMFDVAAQTVLCARCRSDDLDKLAAAIGRSITARYDGSTDG